MLPYLTGLAQSFKSFGRLLKYCRVDPAEDSKSRIDEGGVTKPDARLLFISFVCFFL